MVLQALRGGAVVKERELSGSETDTTNNRMELTAAIRALQALERASSIRIITDSTYLRNGITQWIHGWRRNGWKTADKKPVKNADLWQELLDETARHDVSWGWVKGHAGDEGNERADKLAQAEIKALKKAAKAG